MTIEDIIDLIHFTLGDGATFSSKSYPDGVVMTVWMYDSGRKIQNDRFVPKGAPIDMHIEDLIKAFPITSTIMESHNKLARTHLGHEISGVALYQSNFSYAVKIPEVPNIVVKFDHLTPVDLYKAVLKLISLILASDATSSAHTARPDQHHPQQGRSQHSSSELPQ